MWSGRVLPLLPLALMLLPVGVQAAEPPLLDFVTITRSERLSNQCALTFDDGPNEHTAVLLDLLKDRGIKATFFVLGKRVRLRPDLIKRMVAEGHDIGNHSYDHPDLRRISKAARRQQITETMTLLNALGVKPKYFRPPYGAYNSHILQDLQREGLSMVLWSHDSQDWHYHTAAIMEGNLLPRANPGAHGIFLFHDVHSTTVAAMPSILDNLQGKGCQFVTVDQWVQDNVVHPIPRQPQILPPPTPPAAPLLVQEAAPQPPQPPIVQISTQPPAEQLQALQVAPQPLPQPPQLSVGTLFARAILSWLGRPASAVQ